LDRFLWMRRVKDSALDFGSSQINAPQGFLHIMLHPSMQTVMGTSLKFKGGVSVLRGGR
jgi:hypothetical protein